MPEDFEQPRVPSELALQKGRAVARWLYGALAEGISVSVEEVRARIEEPGMSYDDVSAAYRIADKDNEALRAKLPKAASNEEYEDKNIYGNIRVHEDITFLLHDAEVAYAESQGII